MTDLHELDEFAPGWLDVVFWIAIIALVAGACWLVGRFS